VLGDADRSGRHVEHVPGVLGGESAHHPKQEKAALTVGQVREQDPRLAGLDARDDDLLGSGAPVEQVRQNGHRERRAGRAAGRVRYLVGGGTALARRDGGTTLARGDGGTTLARGDGGTTLP